MTQFGFLSTYPPTKCGLATFTEALAGALAEDGSAPPTVVRVLEMRDSVRSPVVAGRVPTTTELINRNRVTMRTAIRALNLCDVAIVQHSYGIYGGPDGDEIIPLMRALSAPAILVLHTVPAAPSPHERAVLETVCRLAATVVVMTEHARNVLRVSYNVRESKVHVIPHGVPERRALPARTRTDSVRILTWGLLTPDKGLEWGIRAVAQLRDVAPHVEYVIAGQMDPKVPAREAESYRASLRQLIAELDLTDIVRLDERYLDAAQLADLVAETDVVLLPYDSTDQAASGVLVDAVALGIPVVATGFPHAVELLGSGAGLIAEHRHPDSMAAAIRAIVSDERTAARMRDAGLESTKDSSWPAVADRYRRIAGRVVAAAA